MQFAYGFIACERCQIMDIVIAAVIRDFLWEWTGLCALIPGQVTVYVCTCVYVGESEYVQICII